MCIRDSNSVDDTAQRPKEGGGGGLYTYQAIASGSVLRSAVRVLLPADPAGTVEELRRALDGPARIGRSKKDDYGAVLIGAPTAGALSGSARAIALRDQTTVWCLSDVILRDATLTPDPTAPALAAALGDALGVRFEPVADRTHIRARRTDSWQAAWGLPRPSLVGIQAGSVVTFERTGEVDPERLAAVLASGVGERRAEGFGQLCFDDPLVVTREVTSRADSGVVDPGTQPPVNRPATASGLGEPECEEYVTVLAEAAQRDVTRRLVSAFTADPQRRRGLGWNGEKPSNTQLGNLRDALQGAGPAEQFANAKTFFDGINKQKEKWPAGAAEPLGALLNHPEVVWGTGWLGAQPIVDTEASAAAAVCALLHEAIHRTVRERENGRGRDE